MSDLPPLDGEPPYATLDGERRMPQSTPPGERRNGAVSAVGKRAYQEVLESFAIDQWDGSVQKSTQREEATKKRKKKKKKKKKAAAAAAAEAATMTTRRRSSTTATEPPAVTPEEDSTSAGAEGVVDASSRALSPCEIKYETTSAAEAPAQVRVALRGVEWDEIDGAASQHIDERWVACQDAISGADPQSPLALSLLTDVICSIRRHHEALYEAVCAELHITGSQTYQCTPGSDTRKRLDRRVKIRDFALYRLANLLWLQDLNQACIDICACVLERYIENVPVWKFLRARASWDLEKARGNINEDGSQTALRWVESAIADIEADTSDQDYPYQMALFRLDVVKQTRSRSHGWPLQECNRLLNDQSMPSEVRCRVLELRADCHIERNRLRAAVDDYTECIHTSLEQADKTRLDPAFQQRLQKALHRIDSLRDTLRQQAESSAADLVNILSPSTARDPEPEPQPEPAHEDKISYCGLNVVNGQIEVTLPSEDAGVQYNLDDVPQSTKMRLVQLAQCGHSLTRMTEYRQILPALPDFINYVEGLRADVEELLVCLNYSEATVMHHAVDRVLSNTKAENYANRGPDIYGRPWDAIMNNILDFCICFAPFPVRSKGLVELQANARVLAADVYKAAGRMKSARRELDACVDQRGIDVAFAHHRRMDLIILDCPRYSDQDFRRCNLEFVQLLQRIDDGNMAAQQLRIFKTMYERKGPDERTGLDHTVAFALQKRISSMTSEDEMISVYKATEKFKHSSKADESLEILLSGMPQCLRPEACVLLARKIVNSVQAERMLLLFAARLCDKALGYNDECWPAYWFKAAVCRQLRDETARLDHRKAVR